LLWILPFIYKSSNFLRVIEKEIIDFQVLIIGKLSPKTIEMSDFEIILCLIIVYSGRFTNEIADFLDPDNNFEEFLMALLIFRLLHWVWFRNILKISDNEPLDDPVKSAQVMDLEKMLILLLEYGT